MAGMKVVKLDLKLCADEVSAANRCLHADGFRRHEPESPTIGGQLGTATPPSSPACGQTFGFDFIPRFPAC
jgi:hypothetical protein